MFDTSPIFRFSPFAFSLADHGVRSHDQDRGAAGPSAGGLDALIIVDTSGQSSTNQIPPAAPISTVILTEENPSAGDLVVSRRLGRTWCYLLYLRMLRLAVRSSSSPDVFSFFHPQPQLMQFSAQNEYSVESAIKPSDGVACPDTSKKFVAAFYLVLARARYLVFPSQFNLLTDLIFVFARIHLRFA